MNHENQRGGREKSPSGIDQGREDGASVTICRRGTPVVDIVRTEQAVGENRHLER